MSKQDTILHELSSRGSADACFSQINKALQDKVNNLMAEVDSILVKQTDAMRAPKQRPGASLHTHSSTTSTPAHDPKRFDDDGDASSQKMLHQATTVKSTSESVMCLLRDRIEKLQTDLQAIRHEKKKTEEQCKHLESQVRKQEENKEKMLNQHNYYRDNMAKIETANSDLCAKVQAQNAQIISLTKDIENLKKKLASLSQLSNYNELRLNRNLDENDKLRSSLKISRMEEKESREYIRQIQEEKRLALKASEKQRTEIFQAFKKQMHLVNNLKKQKIYLETSKDMNFVEREFAKIFERKIV